MEWNKIEDEILTEKYAYTSIKDLSDILNRKEYQIKKRARKLGLYKKRRWTPEEDNFLICNYDSMNIEEICSHLGRSYVSIMRRLKETHGISSSNYYTAEESEYVKKYYNKINMDKMSSIMGRSISSIHKHASKLGINHKSIWTEEEDCILRDNHLKIRVCDIADILDRDTVSVTNRIAKLGLANKDNRWTDFEISFLLDNIYLHGIDFVCNNINKTKKQILYKAYSLGLNFSKSRRLYPNESFDSMEEVKVYTFISEHKIKIRTNKDRFYYNDINWYVPDFIINDDVIVEYYGLYEEQPHDEIRFKYYNKTHEKNKYYNSLKDYEFIAIYPEDLKNNFEGVYDKIQHLI